MLNNQPRWHSALPENGILEETCIKFVTDFIDNIWNRNRLDLLSHYLHQDFIDHSLPPGLQNLTAFSAYLKKIRSRLIHHTIIEKVTFERDFVVIKVKMMLSSPAIEGREQDVSIYIETIIGYRILAFSDQRIVGHWEFFEN